MEPIEGTNDPIIKSFGRRATKDERHARCPDIEDQHERPEG
jgi:hypothetical protein